MKDNNSDLKIMEKVSLAEESPAQTGKYTAMEIWGQPELWIKVYEQVRREKEELISFLDHAFEDPEMSIILTGAGTSAYIGLSLIDTYKQNFKKTIAAVPTTDLVTHPQTYFFSGAKVLLISFARSGNSPESSAVTHLADQLCSRVFHLIITCDASGNLAKYKSKFLEYVFVLPHEANDKSLAMTGSYSGMLLAGLLISRVKEINNLQVQVDILARYGKKILEQAESFRNLAALHFDRMVFLGSGPLAGCATESHLKVQELTDGQVIGKHDSFLGFRHGPKAVINNRTLVFLLFSNQPYVLNYEVDFIDSLKSGQRPAFTAGIIESDPNGLKIDKLFVLSSEQSRIDEAFLAICFILPAQLIGYFKSLQLGMDPDAPSSSGAISRIVKGVNIYPFE